MSNSKVLIADDDVKLLEALKLRLHAAGYEVIACRDGYQALDFARRHQPDVMLLDINMPAGSGFSVQERIAKIEELAGTPVIYVTGDPSASASRNAKQLGAFAILQKPFDMQQLLAILKAAIERRQKGSAKAAAA